MHWTCHLLSPWPCRCQHLCLFASAVFLWLGVHCRDLFSNDFLGSQTTGLLTGMAGSKTPLQWLCGTISMAVLPPGMWLPCATWGQHIGDSDQYLALLSKAVLLGLHKCAADTAGAWRAARGPRVCQAAGPGVSQLLRSWGNPALQSLPLWCEFGKVTGQSVPLWGMAYQLRIHACFLLLISETSASAMQSKRRKSK